VLVYVLRACLRELRCSSRFTLVLQTMTCFENSLCMLWAPASHMCDARLVCLGVCECVCVCVRVCVSMRLRACVHGSACATNADTTSTCYAIVANLRTPTIDILTYRNTRLTEMMIRYTFRLSDRQTDRQTDISETQTGRQTDPKHRQTGQTHRHACVLSCAMRIKFVSAAEDPTSLWREPLPLLGSRASTTGNTL